MTKLKISPELEMFYRVDDFTDPWTKPETVLMLHGNAESNASWYAWVPTLARQFHVVRPDMRGFGSSTPMPRDFPWTVEVIADDYIRLMDTLGIERFHLVGAKIGGTIARALAGRHPGRVISLALIGTPPPKRDGGPAAIPKLIQEFEEQGVEHWAQTNMAARLGSDFPPEGVEWWIKFMGRTAVSTQIGFMRHIAYADISAYLPRIACPTLVMTSEESGIASVEHTRAWQQTIANSTLLVVKSNSYHLAASHAEQCAQAALEFFSRNKAG